VSVELLECAAQALEPVLTDVVFLGGASIELWITDPAAPAPRPTKDVDVVVEVTSRTAFHAFEERLRSLGFKEEQEDGIICRWRHRDDDLILDAMPADSTILGFENRWQGASIPHAVECVLPSGARIRAAPPAYLLATKLEAFNGRGGEDFLGSRDFGDMIALIDGREELVAEVQQSAPGLRAYLAGALRRLRGHPRFREGGLRGSPSRLRKPGAGRGGRAAAPRSAHRLAPTSRETAGRSVLPHTDSMVS
jgi:nucleotidyltransferase AbiEii toxin of type IV toxin-antitoxin system